jgi:transcriptional regulator with XRE-family HTH domain
MSYFSIALQRAAESRRLSQTDIAKLSGVSRSFISRLMTGDSQELADDNFIALLKVWATSPQTQAEIIAARMMDTLMVARAASIAGASMVDLAVKKATAPPASKAQSPEFPEVDLSHETERAFAWLRTQCPVNPDLEKHLVGYAKMLGMQMK